MQAFDDPTSDAKIPDCRCFTEATDAAERVQMQRMLAKELSELHKVRYVCQ